MVSLWYESRCTSIQCSRFYSKWLYKFWFGSRWILVVHIYLLFWLSLPYQFCTKYQFAVDQWMTIWWAKFELECLLLIWMRELRYIGVHMRVRISCSFISYLIPKTWMTATQGCWGQCTTFNGSNIWPIKNFMGIFQNTHKRWEREEDVL